MELLYHDNHLLVVAKPACLPVVPDESGDESLLDRARSWIKTEYGKPGNVFLGVVHRLDRPVSGVVVFARTSKAAERLSAQFRERTVRKAYWGVVGRAPDAAAGTIEQWLWKDRSRNVVHAYERDPQRAGAKRAVTHWRALESAGSGGESRVLLELVPETGRPHQLRLAAAHLGTPLLGDLKYGADEPLPDKSIGLHALALELRHPTRSEELRFECPPPRLPIWRFDAARP